MHQQDIGQFADIPPGADIFPERPERLAVTGQPVAEIRRDIRVWPANRRADAAGGIVQRAIKEVIGSHVMVMQAPRHIAAIAGDIDVFGLVGKLQGIDRQVGFQEPAMRLRLDHRQLDLFRGQAQVHPRGHRAKVQPLGPTENQLAQNLLHPGGAGLGIGAQNDVVIAERKVVPDRAIHVVIMNFACLYRHLTILAVECDQ